MNTLTQMTKTTRVFVMALVCIISLFARAQAVTPPPDGGYPGQNTAEGEDALFSVNSFGTDNTAIGFNALYSDDYGSSNTAVGSRALLSNKLGYSNTAVGADALLGNDCEVNNTAVGYSALAGRGCNQDNVAIGARAMANASAYGDVAVGIDALSMDKAELNTAVGKNAMKNNIEGLHNAAYGWSAMANNTFGSENTAVGLLALALNLHGGNNTVMGRSAALNNTIGSDNAAYGYFALTSNTTGWANTAIGTNALFNNIGGSNNIALGLLAGCNLTTGDNNIDIGHHGVAEESNTIRIGRGRAHTATYVAGISGATIPGGVGVIVDSKGHLGTCTSSARYKDGIKPMDKASEGILALQPVTFRYKKELDPQGIPQFGLVAEEVAKVDPDLVAKDEDGKPYTVRYEAVNAMLLNEFLKEHKRTEKLEAAVASLIATVKEQAAQIQKVSARIEGSKQAAQLVQTNE